jgi:hypothetical protein
VSSTVTGGYAIDFATDGTNVVWANSNDDTIDVVTSLGGAKTVLATNANGGVSSPVNVALAPSSGDVYWVQQGGELGHTTLGGASPGIISSQTGNVGGLIADDSSASFLISTGGYITLFSCTNSGVCFTQTSTTCSCSADVQSDTMGFEFWGDITDQQVVFMNVVTTGNPPVDYLVTGQPNAYYFTGDGTYAYWGAGTSTYYIARAPINAPTTAQTVVNNSGGSIVGITTDNTNLYFADGTQIYYVNIASAVAAAGAVTPTALTSFASGTTVYPKYAAGAVYFFNSSAIMRIATP